MPLPLETHPLHKPPCHTDGISGSYPPNLQLRRRIFYYMSTNLHTLQSQLLTEAAKTTLIAKALSSKSSTLSAQWHLGLREQWHVERSQNPFLARQAAHKSERVVRKDLKAARKQGIYPPQKEIETVSEVLHCKAYLKQRWVRIQMALEEIRVFERRGRGWAQRLQRERRAWFVARDAKHDQSWRLGAASFVPIARMEGANAITQEERDAVRWEMGVRLREVTGGRKGEWVGEEDIERYKRMRYGRVGSEKAKKTPNWKGLSRLRHELVY